MNNQIDKYHYFCNVLPEVPDFWMPIILDLLKKLDKKIKPKLLPRFILNSLPENMLHKITGGFRITVIKQKFATLRVHSINDSLYLNFINEAISLCNNTCEFCGKPSHEKVMVKSWVRNLCIDCINKK